MKSVSNKIPSLLYSLHLFEKLLDANFGEDKQSQDYQYMWLQPQY